jgi:dipeptidase
MTLGMMNYNAYAPIIKATYAKLEAENDQRQREMEAEYLSIYKERPMEARDMLQRFSDRLLKRALDVADGLEIELMSRLTADIETEYLFHGA